MGTNYIIHCCTHELYLCEENGHEDTCPTCKKTYHIGLIVTHPEVNEEVPC